MRTAPAVTVDVAAGGWARSALSGLCCAAVAVGGFWAFARHDAWGWVTWASIAVLAVATANRAWTRPSMRLRWDGQSWWLGLASPQAQAQPGAVLVALDLGPWMLLRFRAASTRARPRQRWLALQRSDLPSQWHALRCAVYSPHPQAAVAAEGELRA